MGAQRVLVVGAGMAGLRSAEGLRAHGFTGEILVVGDESWAPYNRPPLSKEALHGDLSHDKLVFRVRSNASDVDWRHGVSARHVDLDQRLVHLDDGEVVGYDALVAATGVSARRLQIPGPPQTAAGRRHVIRTLDDAIGLRAALVPGAKVVVLGAGFIGCEVAATSAS